MIWSFLAFFGLTLADYTSKEPIEKRQKEKVLSKFTFRNSYFSFSH